MNQPQPHARVLRSDGKYINLILKTGHLFVCKGCCCGHVERGHAPVPEQLYHSEWERRKLRHRVHLTIGGCLGPCPLSNVVMLNFGGTSLWFQSFNTEWQVLALYDYIEAMLAAGRLLPVPDSLRPFVFNFYAWQAQQGDRPAHDAALPSASPDQIVASILFLSHADTDLLTVSKAIERLPEDFPSVRALLLEHCVSQRNTHGSSASGCAMRRSSLRASVGADRGVLPTSRPRVSVRLSHSARPAARSINFRRKRLSPARHTRACKRAA